MALREWAITAGGVQWFVTEKPTGSDEDPGGCRIVLAVGLHTRLRAAENAWHPQRVAVADVWLT